ncbi:MAG: hypothetical protein JO041_00060 [Acidobacteria bacterium]|nr:hypothetical protein [Acidobacteriota bacterium]
MRSAAFLFLAGSLALCLPGAHALEDGETRTPTPIMVSPAEHASAAESASDAEAKEMAVEQSQRMMGVVPMFGITSRQNARPLTSREKFHLWRKTAFDPFQAADVAIQAGISQAQDEFPSYGQGAAGYSKRYAAALTDSVTSGFFANVAYPVLLKEDPRFFRLGQGSLHRRIAHALTEEFICHKDAGGRSLHFANILAAVSSGAVANLYYPPSERGFSLTMNRAAVSLLDGSAGGLLSEFWPDIQARVFRHSHRQ